MILTVGVLAAALQAGGAQPSAPAAAFPPELGYIALLFLLFVVPKFLQRYHLPGAITSLAMGAAAGLGAGLFLHDPTIHLLSTLGIVALFLFAGLDVDFADLRREAPFLAQHVVVQVVLLAGAAFAVRALLRLEVRPAALVALAILTPSTGFILDSLGRWGLDPRERFWVRSKAIATEIVALAALFVILQSTTAGRLALTTLVLVALVALLPFLFRLFATSIAPYAPRSEFAFLLMVAVLAAYVTRQLGMYYLVGAFVVGVTAQRFRERLPALASEQMLHAVEFFASFFVPFYFFGAGLDLRSDDFRVDALLLGLVFLGAAVPVRVGVVALHRRLVLREPLATGARVALPLVPTLVFTLVIAAILRDRYAVPPMVFGGLIVYTLLDTVLPGLVLRVPPPEFEEPHAPEVEAPVYESD